MTNGGMMYSKGDIVIVQFPFSDLINAKKRPMVVLAQRGRDLIGCAITSNPESKGVPLPKGTLPLESSIKFWQINTFVQELATQKIAKLPKHTHQELIDKIGEMMSI